jgi:thioesterase domain-containing protein
MIGRKDKRGMQQISEASEARQALLQQYLRGELASKVSQIAQPSQEAASQAPSNTPSNTNAEVTSSEARATAIQVGNGLKIKTPFFFLHGDWTGNAIFCYGLARDLGAEQPFYTLDTYDFGSHGTLPSLETIAAEQLKMIRAVQPEGPYQLGGFCNGALIAYEMARQLYSIGQKVDALVLMDAIPPRYTKLRRTIERVGSWLRLSQESQLACFLRLQHVFRLIEDRGKVEDYEFLKQTDPRISGFFPPLETLRKEFAAMFIWATALYEPSYYPGKVTLLWDEAEPVRSTWWEPMAMGKDGEQEIHIMPGSHKTCKTERLGGMAALLAESLQASPAQK